MPPHLTSGQWWSIGFAKQNVRVLSSKWLNHPRNSLLATGALGIRGVVLVPLRTQPLKVWASWKISMEPLYLAGKSISVKFPPKRPSGDVINGQERLSGSSRRMKRTPCVATCEMTLSRTTPTWRSGFLAAMDLMFKSLTTWSSCRLWFDKWFWGDLTPGESVEHVQLPHGSTSGQFAHLFVLLSSPWVSGAGAGMLLKSSKSVHHWVFYRGLPVAFTLEPIHWYWWWSHHWFPSLIIPVVLLVCWLLYHIYSCRYIIPLIIDPWESGQRRVAGQSGQVNPGWDVEFIHLTRKSQRLGP